MLKNMGYYFKSRNNENVSQIYPETAPQYEPPRLTEKQEKHIKPFVTNINGAPYTLQSLPPEVVAAVSSRTSRTEGDLREVLSLEFIEPFIEASKLDEENLDFDPELFLFGKELYHFIQFLNEHPIEVIFSNPKARGFFVKWLAQYGDDSIAQMGGMHLIYPALSQIAIKHMENQRQGIAFLEQSSRYVDLGGKVNGEYKYYRDPILRDYGLNGEYKGAMNNLFDTYIYLKRELLKKLEYMYPEESKRVLKTKVFDTIRGILPVSTTGQVAAFGSGQAFEYLTTRSADYQLNEIGWMGRSGYNELSKITPSFFRRVQSDKAREYREYLMKKREEVANIAQEMNIDLREPIEKEEPTVKISNTSNEGENRVIAAFLWQESNKPFQDVLTLVQQFNESEKRNIVNSVFKNRKERWYKVPRALEFSEVNYEVILNIGAWRDIQRHRTKTQIRQDFTPELGFDIPPLLQETGLSDIYIDAIHRAEDTFGKIANHNQELAQYACTMAHRCRSLHQANLRALFWETELRTIPEGHSDYRTIEQQLAVELKERYPILGEHLKANMHDYLMARRGSHERIKRKEKELSQQMQKSDPE